MPFELEGSTAAWIKTPAVTMSEKIFATGLNLSLPDFVPGAINKLEIKQS